jgi:hypothetical protein
MVKRFWIRLFPLIFLAQGCGRQDEVVAEFAVGHFDKIEFNDSFEVRFHHSDQPKIVARGNEKFVEGLRFKLEGDSLSIESSIRAAWFSPETNKVILDVYADSLREIRASESCDLLSADTLRSENLVVIVGSKLNTCDLALDCEVFGYYNLFPCGGLMRFSGRTEHLNIWNEALMEVHASDLVAQTAFIENRGGGSSRIHVTEALSYSIFDRGDIYLKGDPYSIQALIIEGEGELILVD